jgi:hypothetical protein
MTELDSYYLNQEEAMQSCLLAMRQIILDCDPNITPEWKYRLPFFYYKGKMMCYLWKDKKSQQPYIGFMNGKEMNHPKLDIGSRKHEMDYPFDRNTDLPKTAIEQLVLLSASLISTK